MNMGKTGWSKFAPSANPTQFNPNMNNLQRNGTFVTIIIIIQIMTIILVHHISLIKITILIFLHKIISLMKK